jgi:hypothetical protein
MRSDLSSREAEHILLFLLHLGWSKAPSEYVCERLPLRSDLQELYGSNMTEDRPTPGEYIDPAN